MLIQFIFNYSRQACLRGIVKGRRVQHRQFLSQTLPYSVTTILLMTSQNSTVG